MRPLEVASAMYSKCWVSPFINVPTATMESTVPERARSLEGGRGSWEERRGEQGLRRDALANHYFPGYQPLNP